MLEWIDRLPPSSVYYDFGASNGIFALYAAKRGLKVIAIEPDPSNYFLLSWNAFLNTGSSIDIQAFNVAASDRFAIDRLYIRKMELGAHEKIVGQPSSVSGDAFEPQHVHTIQLVHFDRRRAQFGLPAPEYLKIDVDGHEAPVLDGAVVDSLRTCRGLLIEIEDAKMDRLTKQLSEFGMTMANQHPVQNDSGLWNCIFTRRLSRRPLGSHKTATTIWRDDDVLDAFSMRPAAAGRV
ncbi:methyltransferase FkbM family [Burkholderia sp. lig30]|nr:methyltransferase FkbM family [Burkholderia sp. lig30]